jgi:hypothetical protein
MGRKGTEDLEFGAQDHLKTHPRGPFQARVTDADSFFLFFFFSFPVNLVYFFLL